MPDNQLLDILAREGVLLSVSVRYWRAHKKLKPEDLGLDPDDVTNELISLGHKKLLPKEALAPFALIESRAHALVDANTFPFMGGIAHYLPNTKLPDVVSRLEELERDFREVEHAFKARYGSLRMEAAEAWWGAARKLVSNPSRLVAAIEASFPQPDEMDRYFSFNTHLFQVSIPSASPQLDLVTVADQQAVIEARNRAAAEAARKIRDGAAEFVSDAVATMREETAKLCEEMLASMKSGKTGVHQKTLNRLTKFIDEFKSLNFAGDQQLDDLLEYARKELLSKTAEEYRDSDHARRKLRQGLRNLGDTAREMANADTQELVDRFGALGRRKFNLAA